MKIHPVFRAGLFGLLVIVFSACATKPVTQPLKSSTSGPSQSSINTSRTPSSNEVFSYSTPTERGSFFYMQWTIPTKCSNTKIVYILGKDNPVAQGENRFDVSNAKLYSQISTSNEKLKKVSGFTKAKKGEAYLLTEEATLGHGSILYKNTLNGNILHAIENRNSQGILLKSANALPDVEGIAECAINEGEKVFFYRLQAKDTKIEFQISPESGFQLSE